MYITIHIILLKYSAQLEIHRVCMKEEDKKAGNMSLSNFKVLRIARNVMKMWISRKKLLKFAFQ